MKAEPLRLEEIPRILPGKPVISIAGAGGKTTLMFALAELLPGTCVETTTTKVGAGQIRAAGQQVTADAFPPEDPSSSIWVSPSLIPQNGKITGCSEAEFSRIAAICQERNWPLIAETDGAAMRHIKAPAPHEPVIPEVCNVCFYLAGLDVLNSPVTDETVHRAEIFRELTGSGPGMLIDPAAIIRLLDHPAGGCKNVPPGAVRIAFLTHADTAERIKAAESIAAGLRQYDFVCIR